MQGCALHLPKPEPKQQQKLAIRGLAGWVRLRGTLQVRPWFPAIRRSQGSDPVAAQRALTPVLLW